MLLPLSDLLVDYSELVGKKFTCIDDCGLCCLCQPELLPSEQSFFRSKHPGKVIKKRTPHEHFAISLRNGSGACEFLENRRCTIYQNRPYYCRAFPFHIHISNRVQVELDLSCRGVWGEEGGDAETEGRSLIERNRNAISETLGDASRIYEEFFHNCSEAGIYYPPDLLREDVADKIQMFSDGRYLGTVLETSAEEEQMSLPSGPGSVNIKELDEAARETSLESLQARTLLESPVYCDRDSDWNVFSLKNGKLQWDVLTERGSTGIVRVIDPNEIRLLDVDEGGKKLLINYMKVLNHRDSMMGYAFALVDQYGYEDPLPNVYFGSLATAALDLLWRSSLLAHIRGERTLNEAGIKEGIIFYDMDRLDAPTIGAFL